MSLKQVTQRRLNSAKNCETRWSRQTKRREAWSKSGGNEECDYVGGSREFEGLCILLKLPIFGEEVADNGPWLRDGCSGKSEINVLLC